MTSSDNPRSDRNLISDNTPDSDNYNSAMDPSSHVEYARLRIETSNILVTLKRECENKIVNPVVTLEDKSEYVKERVYQQADREHGGH